MADCGGRCSRECASGDLLPGPQPTPALQIHSRVPTLAPPPPDCGTCDVAIARAVHWNEVRMRSAEGRHELRALHGAWPSRRRFARGERFQRRTFLKGEKGLRREPSQAEPAPPIRERPTQAGDDVEKELGRYLDGRHAALASREVLARFQPLSPRSGQTVHGGDDCSKPEQQRTPDRAIQ